MRIGRTRNYWDSQRISRVARFGVLGNSGREMRRQPQISPVACRGRTEIAISRLCVVEAVDRATKRMGVKGPKYEDGW